MPTIHDVARRAGVASVTVSRYLNASAPVSPGVRVKIERAIVQLGYVPNALAQGLKSRYTRTLGLVVSDVTNPFFTSIARESEDVAHMHGYSLILCNTDEDMSKQERYMGILFSKKVDGLLMTPVGDDSGTITAWRRRSGPITVIDRVPAGMDYRSFGIDIVRGDSLNAAEELVGHLVSHGHRRIGLVNGPLNILTARERRLGYHHALQKVNIPLDPALEFHGPFKIETGRAAMGVLLNVCHPPTAIFATNNFLAIGVLSATRERGLQVPDDIAIVAFDEIPQMELVAPFLTVARQPAAEIGRCATQLLLERLTHERRESKSAAEPTQFKEGREVILEVRIVVRQSCGCPSDPGALVACPH